MVKALVLVVRSLLAIGTAQAQETHPLICDPVTKICRHDWTDPEGAQHIEIVENGQVVAWGVFPQDGNSYGNNPIYGGDWKIDARSGWMKSPKGILCMRAGCGANPF